MKNRSTTISRRSLLSLGGLAFVPAGALAQVKPAAPAAGGGKEVLVKLKDAKIETQKTPKFQVDGPKEKHWKPKDWLEIEFEVEAVYSKSVKDKKQTTYPEVSFKYFVYLQGQTAEKNRILTGEVIHTNVPIGETSHTSMYITPSTILGLTGKAEGNPNAVGLWGVIVSIGGETVGYKVKQGAPGTAEKPWWDDPKAPQKEPGLKNKSETPFAILWADYYLDIKGK